MIVIDNCNEKRFYRAKELAEYLNIAKSTVWRYASKGIITRIKLSEGVTVFDIEEVNKKLLNV